MIYSGKIVVLILSTRSPEYQDFIKAIKNSWANNLSKSGVKCFFYSGGWAIDEIVGDEIRLKVSDSIYDVSEKLIASINLMNKFGIEYNLIYRTNLSSYIEPNNFINYVIKYNLGEDSYGGFIGQGTWLTEYFYRWKYIYLHLSRLQFIFPKKIFFASGSGFFIGRKWADLIVKANPYYYRFIDDVMVSLLINRNILSINRFDINEDGSHKLLESEYQSLINKNLLFHYRFKTKNRSEDALNIGKFNDPTYRESFCTVKQ
jgi:hypothetical protein